MDAGVADTADLEERSSLRQQFEAGASFAGARRHAGAPRRCETSRADGIVSLRYAFADESVFVATFDPRIGYARYQNTATRLSFMAALDLLQGMERDQVGATGCGIDWSSVGVEPRSAEAVAEFEGSICNCKAVLRRTDRWVVELAFSSAC